MPQLMALRAPLAAWRQASSSTQRPIGTISPLSSASGMNSSGGTTPRVGVVPADQRLDADHLRAGEVEDRLVERARTAPPARPRSVEVGLQREPPSRPRTCSRRTARSGPCPRPWRRTAPGRRRAAARRGSSRRRPPPRCSTVTEKSLRPSSSSTGSRRISVQAVGEHVQRRLALAAARQHDELVAAEPPDRVLRRGPRSAAVRRRSCSSWSPAAWPSLSLTCLKPSTSMNRAPARSAGVACRAPSICAARSSTSARLGRPVRASWSAWWESSRVFSRTSESARLRPVPSTTNSESRRAGSGGCRPTQQRERVGVREDPARDGRAEGLHGPAVVEVDLGRSLAPCGSVPAEKATREEPES